jgi:serine acetyltransferase
MDWKHPKIDHLVPTIYGWTCSYPPGLSLAPETDIGCYSYLQCKFGVTLEKGVKLGSHVSVYSEDTIGGYSGPVVIREGTFVGSHSLILPNVTLGPNLVIPAYSFIKKSILNQKELDAFLSAQKTTTLVDLTEAKEVKKYI